jgi:hypothetical protein
MRTIETNLYQFNELSKSAKTSALEEIRTMEIENPWFIHEVNETWKKFTDIFSIHWHEMNYLEPYHNKYRINLDSEILSLSGQRLATYIWNNYNMHIFKGKYYGKLSKYFANGEKIPVSKEHPNGTRHVKRYSRCQLTNDCVLTGVCYDQDILQPIYDFLENPSDIDFENLLENCISSLCSSVQSEYDYSISDCALIELIEANGYEFTELGKLV